MVAYIVGLVIGNMGILPEGADKVQNTIMSITSTGCSVAVIFIRYQNMVSSSWQNNIISVSWHHHGDGNCHCRIFYF